MIVGTAGHVDHGKSALIQALTGRTMDRLAEEKRRGITIDLNFAPFDPGDGRIAGIVDVPGHEDLVRTMVAGASGIDLVLLVIAADEGIMPQTREHLAIIEELGIGMGIPVITKADLVEPDWLEMIRVEVGEWLAGSRVKFDPPVVVSALRGVGLDALRERILDASRRIGARAEDDLFRLPIDRAFSVAGIGTVVTGTAWSGTVAVGDLLHIMPGGREARVRSIEMYGRSVERNQPGARTAIGLAGINREDLRRGDQAVAPAFPWTETTALDVELHLLPDARRALAPKTRVRLHLGTAEVLARVYPRDTLAPGATVAARLALEAPLVARGGDRFVIRSYSPAATIGGGRVLDPAPPRRRATWPEGLVSADPAVRLRALLDRRRDGAETRALPLLIGLSPREVERLLAADPSLTRTGERTVPAALIAELAARGLEVLRRFHQTNPTLPGLQLETFRRGLGGSALVTEAALGDLIAAKRLEVADGMARTPGFRPRVEGGQDEVERIVGVLANAGLTPPTLGELEARVDRKDVAATLRIAAGQGRVIAVERERYYTVEALDLFVAAVKQLGQAGEFTPSALRERLGLSRKYLIPLLEWADAKGITVRVGEARRLK